MRTPKGVAQLAVVGICAALAGCSYPKFTDVVQPQERKAWVERTATVTSDQLGETVYQEVVYADLASKVIDANERVIWVAGVDIKNGKFQRFNERSGGERSVSSLNGTSKTSLINSHLLEIINDQLGINGKLALEKFHVANTDRVYVEFLNTGPMTEKNVEDTMRAWKNLLPKLKDKGLDPTKVILGGAKYEQKINAIVLVKVGA